MENPGDVSRNNQIDKIKKRFNSLIKEQLELGYKSSNRSINLRMLRAYLNATQDSFQSILKGIWSQSQYSKIERGEDSIGDYQARKIEEDLGLPENWLDRDNAGFMFISKAELKLLKAVREISPEATESLVNTLNLLKG